MEAHGPCTIFNNYSTNSHRLPFSEREKLRLYDENAKSKASNTPSLIKIKTELQEIEVYYRSLKKTYLQTHAWK